MSARRSTGVPTIIFMPLWGPAEPSAGVVRPGLMATSSASELFTEPDSSLPPATPFSNLFPGSWSLHELAAYKLPRQQTSVTDFCSTRGREGSGHVLQWNIDISSSHWQESVAPKFSPLRGGPGSPPTEQEQLCICGKGRAPDFLSQFCLEVEYY